MATKKPTCDTCGAQHYRTTGTKRTKSLVQIAPAAGSTAGRSFDSPGKAWCAGWRCKCGHEWLTKGERPTRCPKCKSRTWARKAQ